MKKGEMNNVLVLVLVLVLAVLLFLIMRKVIKSAF